MKLIENVKSEISSSVINQISERLGITHEQANSAVDAGIPTVLAGILKNNSHLSEGGFLDNLMSNVSGTLFGTDNDTTNGDTWLDRGKSLMGTVFGLETNTVANAVANQAGVSEEKSHGLLAMIIPFVTGAVSKVFASNGWNSSDFFTKLWGHKDEISAALPASLGTSLGITNLAPPNVSGPEIETPIVETPVRTNIERPTVVNEPRVERPIVTPHEVEKKSSSFWAWLIPLLLIALALWYFFGRGTSEKMTVVADSTMVAIDTGMDAVKGTINDAGDYIADLGDTIAAKLPDGTDMSVGINSVENRLVSFIEDKDRGVDKETWFTFDRLFFETGKSTLKPESQTQLNNIAAILKAYPSVKLKLGGYTDNTGDAAVNKTISNDRANAALQALVDLGIDKSRLEAEGYGAEHPVASNDSEEGRARNRRIDVRVTNK